MNRLLRETRLALGKRRPVTRRHHKRMHSKDAVPFIDFKQARLLRETTKGVKNVALIDGESPISVPQIRGENIQLMQQLGSKECRAFGSPAPLLKLWHKGQGQGYRARHEDCPCQN